MRYAVETGDFSDKTAQAGAMPQVWRKAL